jgi:hypothetical protein
MRIKIAYCLALALGSILMGCGGGLSRSTAADLLTTYLASQKPTEAKVLFRIFDTLTPQMLQDDQSGLGVLYRLGYVSCCERGRVSLTAKGIEAAAGWELYQHTGEPVAGAGIPVARPELVAVTGITENGPDAAVTYTYREKPINEIGEAMGYGQQTATSSAYFRKFDDGWRMMTY